MKSCEMCVRFAPAVPPDMTAFENLPLFVASSGSGVRATPDTPSGPRRGVQTDGVLVQRWVDSAGPGLRPGRFFLRFLGDFQAKMAYHTTYRTSLESSH